MSLLVCLSLLSGIVVGLKFNVKLLLIICMASIACGALMAFGGLAGPGQSALMVAMAVVALQVGYFVAVVITAMRLTEEPLAVSQEIAASEPGRNPFGARRS